MSIGNLAYFSDVCFFFFLPFLSSTLFQMLEAQLMFLHATNAHSSKSLYLFSEHRNIFVFNYFLLFLIITFFFFTLKKKNGEGSPKLLCKPGNEDVFSIKSDETTWEGLHSTLSVILIDCESRV